jgi:predicted TIM-barrel fold metal-dependent hydrolase
MTQQDSDQQQPMPGTDAWLAQVVEDVIDPERPIIDPHHHLWPDGGALPYGLSELDGDTGDGHNIAATVFVECGAAYDPSAAPEYASVGETRFVATEAAHSAGRQGQPAISAIVANADLRLPSDALTAVLDAHVAAGNGLLRGIRHSLARAPEPNAMMIPGRAAEGLSADAGFRAGVALLGERGLVFDSWHYHHQNAEFGELAAAVPNTTMVLDHFGTPIGVGSLAGRHDEVFETWKRDIGRVAEQPNVVAKLGGLAMPDNGYGWHERATPASSDELVEAQARYYLHTIECFGPERCMFESNFPVDRFSLSYRTTWNAFKKIASSFSAPDQQLMFHDTAARVYGLQLS